ncbi:MAG: amino acid ABC transporter permease [Spirochaetaceae bacterium]
MELSNFAHYFLNIDVIIETFPALLKGLWLNVQIAVFSLAGGLTLGAVLAVIRVTLKRKETPWYYKILNAPLGLYVDGFRAIPPLVALIIIYYALPYLGLSIPRFWAAVLTFIAILSAFASEIFRAGIESIPKEQSEASRAIGLSYVQSMIYVILPQGIRISMPPLTSRMVSVTKDVALASVIGVADLLKEARSAQSFLASPTPLILAAVMFIIFFFPFVRLANWFEYRWKQ